METLLWICGFWQGFALSLFSCEVKSHTGIYSRYSNQHAKTKPYQSNLRSQSLSQSPNAQIIYTVQTDESLRPHQYC